MIPCFLESHESAEKTLETSLISKKHEKNKTFCLQEVRWIRQSVKVKSNINGNEPLYDTNLRPSINYFSMKTIKWHQALISPCDADYEVNLSFYDWFIPSHLYSRKGFHIIIHCVIDRASDVLQSGFQNQKLRDIIDKKSKGRYIGNNAIMTGIAGFRWKWSEKKCWLGILCSIQKNPQF